MASKFTRFPLDEDAHGVVLHAAYQEIVDAVNSYGDWLYDPTHQYPLIAQPPGSVMRYDMVQYNYDTYWRRVLKDKVKVWASAAGTLAAAPTNPPTNSNWFVAIGWEACCQELFGTTNWPSRGTGMYQPAVAAELNDMWRVICWCSGKWYRYSNSKKHPDWPGLERTGTWMTDDPQHQPRAYGFPAYYTKEAACSAYDGCSQEAQFVDINAGSRCLYGVTGYYDPEWQVPGAEYCYYIWAGLADNMDARHVMTVSTLKAPSAAAITDARFRFSYDNHHRTDDPDRDPYTQPLIDPNASPCPVRLYVGTSEPGHGFSSRSCGTLWYEEDMTGTGRDTDRGWYILHQLRSLNPNVLVPGSWHWVRCAGRSAIDGDLDSVDWPFSPPDYDPAYGDWESHWLLGEFYFQVQWEYY